MSYVRVFAKPAISSVIMGLAAWACYGLFSKILLSLSAFSNLAEDGQTLVLSGTGNALATLGAIAVGGVIYLVLIIVLRAISKEDLALMPKGDKIAKLLRIR